MISQDDYYKILGVAVQANTDDIKKAYRKLMLKYHPDVASEPLKVDYFESVVRAYKVLSDHKKRVEYNQSHRIHSNINQTKGPNTKTEVNEYSKTESKRFGHFKFNLFNRSKSNGHESNDDFFKIPKEIRSLSIDRLKEQLLQSSNKYVRAEALKAIVVQWGKQGYKLITHGLGDQSREVKEVAVRAIGKLKIRQGLTPLIELYPKSGPNMRKVIIRSIASLEIAKSNEWLVKSCYDSNDYVRLEAVKTLKKYKLYSYLPKIKGLAHDRNPEINELVKGMLKTQGLL